MKIKFHANNCKSVVPKILYNQFEQTYEQTYEHTIPSRNCSKSNDSVILRKKPAAIKKKIRRNIALTLTALLTDLPVHLTCYKKKKNRSHPQVSCTVSFASVSASEMSEKLNR